MFLSNLAEFSKKDILIKAGNAILNNPGKAILGVGALSSAGALGGSYLNKKDKRTLKQRVVDIGKSTTPTILLSSALLGGRTQQLLANKGKLATGLGIAGITGAAIAGNRYTTKLRQKHAEETQKRKKGQRLVPHNMNVLGRKYTDYAPMKVY